MEHHLSVQNPYLENQVLLEGSRPGKNEQSRLRQYLKWMADQNLHWLQGNLSQYSQYLVSEDRVGGPLSPNSANAHLSTIRRQIKRVLSRPESRQQLFGIASERCVADGYDPSPANLAVYVNELERMLFESIAPENTRQRAKTIQDRPDSQSIRLTYTQVNQLLEQPNPTTLKGLRDLGVIAMLVCTGLREQELCDLQVSDLRQTVNGVLGVLVQSGKGDKQRVVPYGADEWVLHVVDKWLQQVARGENLHEDSPVFRGLWRGGRIHDKRLNVRSVQRILKQHPIMIDGKLRSARPHDLRRTCARRWYDDGMDLLSIQANLGHVNIETTKGYIGDTDMRDRQSVRGYQFDLGRLG